MAVLVAIPAVTFVGALVTCISLDDFFRNGGRPLVDGLFMAVGTGCFFLAWLIWNSDREYRDATSSRFNEEKFQLVRTEGGVEKVVKEVFLGKNTAIVPLVMHSKTCTGFILTEKKMDGKIVGVEISLSTGFAEEEVKKALPALVDICRKRGVRFHPTWRYVEGYGDLLQDVLPPSFLERIRSRARR